MTRPIILITGAAGGIGRALADRLLAENVQLVLADIDHRGLKAAYQPLPSNCLIRSLDVRSSAAWQALLNDIIDTFGRIDALFNLAGVIMPGRVFETPLENIDYHFDINVKGVMIGMRLVSEHMVRQKAGHIINVASLAGIAPVPGISLYSASKFAVRGYSLATANELHEFGVAVTVVCPGLVNTPMLDLQLAYEDAALTFSNGDALDAKEVARVLHEALDQRPVEICLPNGILPKITSAFPRLNRWLKAIMLRRGRSAMARLKSGSR